MARISSGSSEGASWAERWGADDAGTSRWSELRLFGSRAGWAVRRGRRAEELGVIAREEWISPRLFLGVLLGAGLLILKV
jgi:hypothetical protein